MFRNRLAVNGGSEWGPSLWVPTIFTMTGHICCIFVFHLRFYIHFVLFQIVENAGHIPWVAGARAFEPCDASDLSHHCSDSQWPQWQWQEHSQAGHWLCGPAGQLFRLPWWPGGKVVFKNSPLSTENVIFHYGWHWIFNLEIGNALFPNHLWEFWKVITEPPVQCWWWWCKSHNGRGKNLIHFAEILTRAVQRLPLLGKILNLKLKAACQLRSLWTICPVYRLLTRGP